MGENKKSVTITVNGDVYQLAVGNAVGDIAPADTLAETLWERLLLTGNYCRCISHSPLPGRAAGYPRRNHLYEG